MVKVWLLPGTHFPRGERGEPPKRAKMVSGSGQVPFINTELLFRFYPWSHQSILVASWYFPVPFWTVEVTRSIASGPPLFSHNPWSSREVKSLLPLGLSDDFLSKAEEKPKSLRAAWVDALLLASPPGLSSHCLLQPQWSLWNALSLLSDTCWSWQAVSPWLSSIELQIPSPFLPPLFSVCVK